MLKKYFKTSNAGIILPLIPVVVLIITLVAAAAGLVAVQQTQSPKRADEPVRISLCDAKTRGCCHTPCGNDATADISKCGRFPDNCLQSCCKNLQTGEINWGCCSGGGGPTSTPTPTPTPTLVPCDGGCTDNTQCQSSYQCINNKCRNASCPDETDCDCYNKCGEYCNYAAPYIPGCTGSLTCNSNWQCEYNCGGGFWAGSAAGCACPTPVCCCNQGVCGANCGWLTEGATMCTALGNQVCANSYCKPTLTPTNTLTPTATPTIVKNCPVVNGSCRYVQDVAGGLDFGLATLTWTDVSYEDYYQIKRNGIQAGSADQNATSWDDIQNLVLGQTYTYSVNPVNYLTGTSNGTIVKECGSISVVCPPKNTPTLTPTPTKPTTTITVTPIPTLTLTPTPTSYTSCNCDEVNFYIMESAAPWVKVSESQLVPGQTYGVVVNGPGTGQFSAKVKLVKNNTTNLTNASWCNNDDVDLTKSAGREIWNGDAYGPWCKTGVYHSDSNASGYYVRLTIPTDPGEYEVKSGVCCGANSGTCKWDHGNYCGIPMMQ